MSMIWNTGRTNGRGNIMDYISTAVNDCPLISVKAGAALTDVRGRAVKFDDSGRLVLAAAGDTPLGVAALSNDENIPEGGDVDIQLWAVGFVRTGAAIKPGNALAPDGDGAFIPVADGGAYSAIALKTAAAGAFVSAHITSGVKSATNS